jgi:hypothetical protein
MSDQLDTQFHIMRHAPTNLWARWIATLRDIRTLPETQG